MTDAHDLSTGVFIRGLNNLKTSLIKAQDHAAASNIDEATFLDARLAVEELLHSGAHAAPADLHMYTLSAQVHWAAEGAKLAIMRLLGESPAATAHDAKNFSHLYERLDAALTYLSGIPPSDLAAGIDRALVIEHPRGSVYISGHQFLLAYAIPHFFYHVTTAHGILRNQGVRLNMGDFLGNWSK